MSEWERWIYFFHFFWGDSGEIWLWREDKEDRRRKNGGEMYKIVINWQILAWQLDTENSLWYWNYSMALKVIITILIAKKLPRNPPSFPNRVGFTPKNADIWFMMKKLECKEPSQDVQGRCWVRKMFSLWAQSLQDPREMGWGLIRSHHPPF